MSCLILTKYRTCLEFTNVDPVWSPFLSTLLTYEIPLRQEYFIYRGPYYNTMPLLQWFAQARVYEYEHLINLPETYRAIMDKDDKRLSALLSHGQAISNSRQILSSSYLVATTMSSTLR